MNIYFDTEFTGLHQHTTLISIGCLADDGQTFYAECTDYDRTQVDDWIQTNVIDHLQLADRAAQNGENGTQINGVVGPRAFVADQLRAWLSQFDQVTMVSDVLAYDWTLFCELFGGAFGVPSQVYYIPIDLASLFVAAGVDPDVNREAYAGMDGTKHHALHDARVIQACYQRVMQDLRR